MMRKFCAAIAVFGLGAAGVTAAASPAVAAGSCSIVLPAKVSIKSGSTTITGRPGADCKANDMSIAEWNVSPSDFGDGFFFTADSLNSSYVFYSSLDRIGVLRAVPAGASSSTGTNDLAQNSPTYTVKYGTWAYIASTRSGSVVHIGGQVHQWSTDGLGNPQGRRVYLQRYRNGAWQNLVSQSTDSRGRVSFGFVQPSVAQYRLSVPESARGWSAASASTFR